MAGSLNYIQTGGTVTISGRNQQNTRGKLEILNNGSLFNMSGGNLIIVNGGGDPAYFGDLNIVPESSSVTGGTIQLGTTNTIAGATQTFYLNSAARLWNLTIDGTTNIKTVYLRVNPLVLGKNLTINGNSIFSAGTQGWNVSIGGDLTNNNNNSAIGLTNGGYQPGKSTQITTFTGTGLISGVASNLTNFANFVLASSGTVTLGNNSNIRINGNMNLSSGILADGGQNISLAGNIDNNAVHTSSSTSGGIEMAGTQLQIISGNGYGIFGNLILNNASNIEMHDNSVVNGQLTFTQGNLYIDDYLLTIGPNATISGQRMLPG